MEAPKYYALIAMKRNYATQNDFDSKDRFINVLRSERRIIKWAKLFDSKTGELVFAWDSPNDLPKQN